MRILGISGSLRRGSHNRALLRAAAATLPPGATLDVWDGLASIPAFDEDLEAAGVPDAVEDLKAAIRDADALLVATPEYNSSLPGALKNAMDWASRPYATNVFRDKPAAVVGSSTGLFGAVWAQAEARKVLTYMGAKVLDVELPVGMAHAAFDEDGRLADPEQQARLHAIVRALADTVGADAVLAA